MCTIKWVASARYSTDQFISKEGSLWELNIYHQKTGKICVCCVILLIVMKNQDFGALFSSMGEEAPDEYGRFCMLEVKNRHRAVDKAIEFGLIEPQKVKV